MYESGSDKRYRSVRQVENAFFHKRQSTICVLAVVILTILILGWKVGPKIVPQEDVQTGKEELTVLPSPASPHWEEDTGIALWGNVPESGVEGEVDYDWRLYRCDTPTPPNLETSEWGVERKMRGNDAGEDLFALNLSCEFWDNGYYYFAVRASGDGVNYADSPYVLSDAFEYTGAEAPRLPTPQDLSWTMQEDLETDSRVYYTAFSNLDDYDDKDSFEAFIYDETGEYIMSNIVTKKDMIERGWPGIRIRENS